MKYHLMIILLLIITGCTADQEYKGQSHHMDNKERSAKDYQQAITIAAIGDLLIHDRVYNDAWDGERYDFQSMLAPVQNYLQKPTIAMANQESIMGGEELGLSNYPRFNSPFDLADDIQKTGVDLVTMANNHTLDKGEVAIHNAIDYYEKIGLRYTGAFKSQADQDTIRVIETDAGISAAFLSYTYGTNGIPVPDGKEYLVNQIDRLQIKSDVLEAEKLADITIVSYHFGQEYMRQPNQEQQDLVQFAADLGTDVVIGHHPHVLQPIEWVEGEQGNKTLVAYSLGNFLSGQYELNRRIGGIFQFTVEKQGDSVSVHTPAFLPTFVQFEMIDDTMTNVEVLPLGNVTNQQLSDAKVHLEEIKQHVSQNIEGLQFIE
ncbi:CapA family protein [Gracilibacillus caseinilyticus]|uniref:CapA family protein n=1 Tax=Gracilibacillus caseinilyticus TaxID=2932256 RepID=A0ABY4EXZ0_9BACI|nr:CapA family protein [Gracilibacillus caseinilyticus]UOQ49144.1 CapA family protein [Gracilibacillus caseinilyticus]